MDNERGIDNGPASRIVNDPSPLPSIKFLYFIIKVRNQNWKMKSKERRVKIKGVLPA